jgi:competence protein CoiA
MYKSFIAATNQVNFAQTPSGKIICPDTLSEDEWLLLKRSFKPGILLMPCCKTPAIPKTSPNGVRFFAHNAGECISSPETRWHLSAKDLISSSLAKHGINPMTEQLIAEAGILIRPDVQFEYKSKTFAIELQYSYITLSEYLRRQERYEKYQLKSYWLISRQSFLALVKSLGKLRLRRDYAGQFPGESGIMPAIPELPIAMLDLDSHDPRVRGPGGLDVSVATWINSIVNEQFIWREGAWIIA